MQEQDLRELGIFRIPVPIPFRQAGGPVNVYLIEEERGFLLYDTGLGTEESRAALAEGIARSGHQFEDLNRIIVSHGHIDHYGAAAWIQEQAGHEIPIHLHPADSAKVLQSGPDWPTLLTRNQRYLSSLGVPVQVQQETAAIIARNGDLGRRLPKVMPLSPGDRFPCRHVTLEVLHMPGHTPGVCCLYERRHRLLFSADHLLERVSPNPLIELGMEGRPPEYKPLISYFKSIERLRAIPIELVLPGHAAPFSNCLKVINSLAGFYEKRQERLLKALEAGPLTVYEVMRELFESDTGFELFLMLSETLGNLEALEERGKVEREKHGDVIRFRI
jgi:glyoxylase-like metal-dependent hydrolase (beta-lactamase superfamily II)